MPRILFGICVYEDDNRTSTSIPNLSGEPRCCQEVENVFGFGLRKRTWVNPVNLLEDLVPIFENLKCLCFPSAKVLKFTPADVDEVIFPAHCSPPSMRYMHPFMWS